MLLDRDSRGDTKLPRQIDPNDEVRDKEKFFLSTLLQHVDKLSGSDHHVATTPATVTWMIFWKIM
jgi:hypothetical protein